MDASDKGGGLLCAHFTDANLSSITSNTSISNIDIIAASSEIGARITAQGHVRRWIVDAHREGRRYIVHSAELLSAFLELEQTLLLLRNQ